MDGGGDKTKRSRAGTVYISMQAVVVLRTGGSRRDLGKRVACRKDRGWDLWWVLDGDRTFGSSPSNMAAASSSEDVEVVELSSTGIHPAPPAIHQDGLACLGLHHHHPSPRCQSASTAMDGGVDRLDKRLLLLQRQLPRRHRRRSPVPAPSPSSRGSRRLAVRWRPRRGNEMNETKKQSGRLVNLRARHDRRPGHVLRTDMHLRTTCQPATDYSQTRLSALVHHATVIIISPGAACMVREERLHYAGRRSLANRPSKGRLGEKEKRRVHSVAAPCSVAPRRPASRPVPDSQTFAQ